MTSSQGDKRRPRDGKGRYVRDVNTAQADAKACELRQYGYSYQRIADELGLSHRDLARRAVERALAATVSEPAAELRALELVRLDSALVQAFRVMHADHLMISGGGVVLHPDTGEPLPDDGPRLAAIDRILRIGERRAKLLGLDAPMKVEQITMAQLDEEIVRLTAELAGYDQETPG